MDVGAAFVLTDETAQQTLCLRWGQLGNPVILSSGSGCTSQDQLERKSRGKFTGSHGCHFSKREDDHKHSKHGNDEYPDESFILVRSVFTRYPNKQALKMTAIRRRTVSSQHSQHR